jgi:hypothetical protein
MQDLLANLLWQNEEIDEAADRLRRSLPGFPEAEQAYDTLAARLRAAAGPELYDQFYNCFMRYTGYEVQAYYTLGLGLRGELARALGLYSPK